MHQQVTSPPAAKTTDAVAPAAAVAAPRRRKSRRRRYIFIGIGALILLGSSAPSSQVSGEADSSDNGEGGEANDPAAGFGDW